MAVKNVITKYSHEKYPKLEKDLQCIEINYCVTPNKIYPYHSLLARGGLAYFDSDQQMKLDVENEGSYFVNLGNTSQLKNWEHNTIVSRKANEKRLTCNDVTGLRNPFLIDFNV